MRTRLHHLVEEAASTRPLGPALTYRNETLDYGELWQRVRQLAAGLLDLGLARSDRVAIYLDKRIETVTSIYATSVVGAAFVPVNPVFKPPQVAHVLADSQARLLVTSSARLQQIAEHLGACPSLRDILLVDEPSDLMNPEALPRVTDYGSASGWGPPVHQSTPRGVDRDVAAILYTSGSTGRPKGVVLSHRNLIAGAESVSSYLSNTADDVILSLLPLSFDAGLSQLTTAAAAGAHVVLMNYLLARDVVRECSKHQVTGLTCVPPLWFQLAEAEWPYEATRSMRYLANTGGRMPKSTLARLRGIFPGASPFLMYGLTEAFRSTYLDPQEVERRPDSIGKAIPNAEILVVRPDGTPCGPGEEGELVHRGPLVALGYWRDPERTAQRFRPVPGDAHDWTYPEVAVWSGDTVVSDEDGFLYFVGRSDDMIKTSGYRVSPTEIEEVAYGTGLVRDAVALGLRDDRLGQRIVLLVTSGTEPLDIQVLVKAMQQELPLYMVPSEVIIRDNLPYSPNGKFDRVLLKRELSS
jgi:acyl-CoA ligase (AMP-forming) (exosortase A-associated)